METFAERAVNFFRELQFYGSLPSGISIMNPFRDNPVIMSVINQFFSKYYSDTNMRHLLLGINPGRFGAGVTGISFTDTIRLNEKCGISLPGVSTYEISSEFIYEMIDAYGGCDKFYSEFFISSVSPLGFISVKKKSRSHLMSSRLFKIK